MRLQHTNRQKNQSKQARHNLKIREKTCKLIDMKIPADKNVSVAEFEKLCIYKYLEIYAMANKNCDNPCRDWDLMCD